MGYVIAETPAGRRLTLKPPTTDDNTIQIFTKCNGNYSATSNNIKLVHWPRDGWAVTFGTERRGLGGAAARPDPSSLYQM